MKQLQIEDFYQPPAVPVGRNKTVLAHLSPHKKLVVVNLTDAQTLLQKSFTTDSVLSCSGLFDLEIRIRLGSLLIRQQKLVAGTSFTSAGPKRYEIEILDESTGEMAGVVVEHYLPSFYPFVQMGIRLSVENRLVFEQGKIPNRFWSFG